MKKLFKNVNDKWKEYALAGCVTVTLLVVLLNIGKILNGIASFLGMFSSVFLGVVIAYVLNPLAVLFSKTVFGKIKNRKAGWTLSVALSVVIVLGFIVLVVSMLVPQVAGNIQYLLDNAEGYLDNVMEKYKNHPFFSSFIPDDVNEYLLGENGVVEKLTGIIASNMRTLISTASNVGGKAANVAVGSILALYFLLAKEAILKGFSEFFKLILSPLNYIRGSLVFEKFNTILSRYIVCELVDALLIGLLNYLFMIVWGMPNALFISFIVAVTNLAPTFGPIFGAVIGAFVLLLSSPDKVVIFLIFTLALQTVDAYVVKPKLFGGALNVPGVLILISIIVCGKLLGITGMLLAIPVAAIAVYVYDEIFISHMELKRDLDEYKKELKK